MYNQVIKTFIPNAPIFVGISKVKNPSSFVPIHFHDEVEIIKIIKGNMTCTIYDKTILLNEGDIIFINARTPHETAVLQENTMLILLQFNIDKLSENYNIRKYKNMSKFLNNNMSSSIYIKNGSPLCAEVSQYLLNIREEFLKKDKAYEIYTKANVYSLLGAFYRHNILLELDSKYDVDALNKIMPAVEYIDENFNKQISLDELSSLLNINLYYFCRLFKNATDSTFVNYLNFVRILEAEELLTSSSKSIMEISLDVGFSDVTYFNRIFKKLKNCTPTDYRKIKYFKENTMPERHDK